MRVTSVVVRMVVVGASDEAGMIVVPVGRRVWTVEQSVPPGPTRSWRGIEDQRPSTIAKQPLFQPFAPGIRSPWGGTKLPEILPFVRSSQFAVL